MVLDLLETVPFIGELKSMCLVVVVVVFLVYIRASRRGCTKLQARSKTCSSGSTTATCSTSRLQRSRPQPCRVRSMKVPLLQL